MGLDVRTIMVMFAMLAFMFFCLFELAGLRVGRIRGVRQWAVANLCIGLGFSLSYFFGRTTPGHDWAVVIGVTLIATGACLQLTGIQAFKEQPTHWRLVMLFIGVILCQSIWFNVVHPDFHIRAIVNSFFFFFIYAVCARVLLVKTEASLRVSYWFTGVSFAFMAMVMLARGVIITQSPDQSIGLHVNTAINTMPFIIGCLVQFCIAFGLLLMLNHRLIADVYQMASRDALTGTLNRRRIEEDALRLRARCMRTGETLAIMMIDIDFFKTINDRYGHPAGDKVLCSLAEIAQNSIRPDDYFARYGGEEFCMLLTATTEKEAFELAERLRLAFAEFTLTLGKDRINVTVSIGVADSNDIGLVFEDLVTAADQALYRAKQKGRNQVITYSSMRANDTL
ncbi:GGDEF domain-containing protein [Methylotenera sp.]|uniref:GGDEF domain-containing protein n=1 Tax=Methylotenera sp. TaxID=2051956 RepID=UPI002734994A|nr:GGDEF domain-containing protein [Methylotenera sp.]MDP3211209.1 GGDEF domain-containing protein [Methylotenera sp.]MDP3777965.1 GGDEF domain-containing protein [Methylotenera sp.]